MKYSSLFILAVMMATPSHAEIPLTPNNPLYSFAHDSEGNERSKFEIDYDTLSKYYQFVAGGLLQTNFAPTLEAKDHSPLSLSEGQLTFKVNLETMTITPKQEMSPESAQSLFNFDPQLFISQNNGKDLADAQINFFRKRDFDETSQRYERTYLHLSDWKSLIHPPIKNVGKTPEEQDLYFRSSHQIPADSKMLTSEFNQKIDSISDSELTRGNQMKLLVNGESFKEKMAQVKAAKKSIYVGVMSFASDPTSFALIDALVEKAKEGVEVQVMLEKLWTVTVFRNTMKRFTDGGVKLVLADDMMTLNKKKRTLFHNKVWIFDDETAIVGGQNIVNSSNSSSGFNHWNKDTDVRIQGPMVTDIMNEYTTLTERYDTDSERKINRFNLNQGRTIEQLRSVIADKKSKESAAGLRGKEKYANWFSTPETATQGVCRYVIQGAQKENTILANTYSEYFRAAKNELFLTSQHIEYDQDEIDGELENQSEASKMFQALFDTSRSGVRVDLLANGIDGGFAEIGQNISKGRDNPRREAKRLRHFERQIARGKEPSTFMSRMSTWLGLKGAKKFKSFLDDAISYANFNAWMHFQYIHSKTVLIDNIMASVGSFNFEPYSADHSHESAVICYDRQLTTDLKTDMIRDIVNSTPVLPEMSDNSTAQNTAEN